VSIESAVASGRRLLATSFLDTGRVERRMLSGDGAGGQTETWVAVATVPCRFGTIVDQMPNRYVDTTYGPETAPILCALGTDVHEGDHFVNVTNGDVWLIIGDKTPASVLAVSMRLNARRV
jgi:hypothetical protein